MSKILIHKVQLSKTGIFSYIQYWVENRAYFLNNYNLARLSNLALVRVAHHPTLKFSDLSQTLRIQFFFSFVNIKFCTANLSDHLGSKFHLSQTKKVLCMRPQVLRCNVFLLHHCFLNYLLSRDEHSSSFAKLQPNSCYKIAAQLFYSKICRTPLQAVFSTSLTIEFFAMVSLILLLRKSAATVSRVITLSTMVMVC